MLVNQLDHEQQVVDLMFVNENQQQQLRQEVDQVLVGVQVLVFGDFIRKILLVLKWDLYLFLS